MIGGGPLEATTEPSARSKLLQDLGVVKIADFGLSKSLKLQLRGGGGGGGGDSPPPRPEPLPELPSPREGGEDGGGEGAANGRVGPTPSFKMTGGALGGGVRGAAGRGGGRPAQGRGWSPRGGAICVAEAPAPTPPPPARRDGQLPLHGPRGVPPRAV
jgi:hypothetical protein